MSGRYPLAMPDEELARELCPDAPDVGLRAIAKMTSRERAHVVQLVDTHRAMEHHRCMRMAAE